MEFDLADALRAFMRDFGSFGFEDFFGTGRASARAGRRAGNDLQIKIRLTIREVAGGVEKQLKVNKMVRCKGCGGTGARAGARPVTCSVCGGSGQIRRVQRSIFGQFVNVTECHHCNGGGTVIADPCNECGGSGKVRGSEKVSVKIPAGVASGNYITISGGGDAGERGGPPGNLYVIIEEEEDSVFERHGNDILVDMPVTVSQLALGAKIEVPTLDGKVILKIPPGTPSHKIFRIKGKGIPRLNSYGRGDELVRVVAWIPDRLSRREAELLGELDESMKRRVPPPGKS